LAVGAWAQSDTLTLVNVGPGNVMGGVFTSPYGISIDGSTTPVPLICDDFATDTSIGETWTATQTTFAAIESGTNPLGTPKFTPVDIQNYATVAVLAAELMAVPDDTLPADAETLGEISYALWAVFDPSLLQTAPGSDPFGTLSPTEFNQANLDLANAEALVAGATNHTTGDVNLSAISINGSPIEGMTIYTPNPTSASQEFISVTMPEPATLPVLGVYLLFGAGGLFFLGRRRIFRSTTAKNQGV